MLFLDPSQSFGLSGSFGARYLFAAQRSYFRFFLGFANLGETLLLFGPALSFGLQTGFFLPLGFRLLFGNALIFLNSAQGLGLSTLVCRLRLGGFACRKLGLFLILPALCVCQFGSLARLQHLLAPRLGLRASTCQHVCFFGFTVRVLSFALIGLSPFARLGVGLCRLLGKFLG
jgi:hypothetical protein